MLWLTSNHMQALCMTALNNRTCGLDLQMSISLHIRKTMSYDLSHHLNFAMLAGVRKSLLQR